MNVISFTELRKNLKTVMDSTVDRHEPVIVNRPHGKHVIMISLNDYESLRKAASKALSDRDSSAFQASE